MKRLGGSLSKSQLVPELLSVFDFCRPDFLHGVWLLPYLLDRVGRSNGATFVLPLVSTTEMTTVRCCLSILQR